MDAGSEFLAITLEVKKPTPFRMSAFSRGQHDPK
jgi:hypothetical protein